MSECVVRMEMPQGCWDCPCVNGEYGFCQADKDERKTEEPNERPSWCPIICALPENHGRLVDAEELESRTRPVKNFENQDSLVIGAGPLRCSKTIVPAERREE